MKIKSGDHVVVIAGKDKGKLGKVIQVFPQENRLVVDKVNKMTRHLKTRARDQKGQKIEFFAPISASNVMIVCPSCKKRTRVTHSIEGDDKKRICKKCKEAIS
jgi:large subunit ribosomal protein L24